MRFPRSPEDLPLGTLQAFFLGELLGRETFGVERRALHFRTPPRGTVESRWHVYSSGYHARIIEALENDYPATRRVMGAGPFGSLVHRYLAKHPPRSFDLRYAGELLSSFLRHDPVVAELPFLPDLAWLEWLLAEAFLAKDAVPLSWSDLQGMDPEKVAELPLVVNPGTFVIRSTWPLIDIWKLKDKSDGEVSLNITGRPSVILVFRKGLKAFCRNIDELDARMVETAEGRASLATFQAALAPGEEPEVVHRLLESFRRLVDEGIFATTADRMVRSRP